MIIIFSSSLRKEREKAGLTQIQLAKKLNIPVTTYRNYENTTRQPDYEILKRISETLSVSIDSLLENNSQTGNLSSLIFEIRNFDKKELSELSEYIEFIKFKRKTNNTEE